MTDQHNPGFLSRLREGLAHALAGDLLEKKAGQKTPIDAGMIAAAIRGQVQATVSGSGADTWMGPRDPLLPQAPPEVKGRAWDYPVGINMQYTPRGTEMTSFAQMRALADGYDLLSLAIETRKDQLAKLQWSVKPRDPKGKADARCKEVEEFFLFPDREHSWDDWIRAVVDEMLVTDATTLYPRLTRAGKPYQFELMDGATIKRVIDPSGRTPEPPDVAYQQVLKGVVAADYHADELIYAPRNARTWKLYGRSPVEQVIMTVNIAIRRQLSQLQFYTDGSTPDLILEVPDTWQPDQVKAFGEWWEMKLAGNTAARRAPIFVPKGVHPINTKEGLLKDEYDEWLARIICYAFSLSPQPFVKQMNRATAETAQEAALMEGLLPLMVWVRNLINRAIWKYWGYNDLTFAWIEEEAIDPEVQAKVNDLKLRNGTKLINEARADDGMDPIEGGDEPMIVTATGAVLLKDVLNPPEPVLAPGDPGMPPAADGNAKLNPKADDSKKPTEKLLKSRRVPPINRSRKAVKTATAGMRKIMATLLDDQMPDIVKQLGKAIGATAKADDPKKVDNEVDRILQDLDFSGWAVVVGDVQDIIDQITRDGGAQALVQIGIKDTDITEQVNARALEFAKDRAAELVGKQWSGGKLVDNPNAEYAITDGTRELLRSTVYQAIDERWSIDELAAAIAEGNAFSEDRANLIARTEVARADVQGNMAGYRESGVVQKKVWLLSSDHDIDDECNESADQGEIDLDEAFVGGDAPPAHPGCFLAGTIVTAVGVSAHFKRWFAGEVVILSIPGADDLSVTPNHPILTESGWLPAGILKVGDKVLQCRDPSAAATLIDPHDNHVPTRIEDIASALLMSGGVAASRMPTSTEAFHGDGLTDGEVDVVWAASALTNDRQIQRGQNAVDRLLGSRHGSDSLLDCHSGPAAFSKIDPATSGGVIGGGSASGSLCASEFGGDDLLDGRVIPDGQAGTKKGVAQGGAVAADAPSDINARLAGDVPLVNGGQVVVGESASHGLGFFGTSHDESSGQEFATDGAIPNTDSLAYIRERLAGFICAVQISDVRKIDFSGHVHNLSTRDGWYFANGVIAHNCQCDVVPVVYENDTEKSAMAVEIRKIRNDLRDFTKAVTALPSPAPNVIVESPVHKVENTINVPDRETHVHLKAGKVTKTITTRRGEQGQLLADVVETTE